MEQTKLQDWGFFGEFNRFASEISSLCKQYTAQDILDCTWIFEWKLQRKHFLIWKRTTFKVELSKEPGKLQRSRSLAFEQTLKTAVNVYIFGVA